ncbi:OprO/OprP family phosphate-selective porin [Pedomonas mirosovicensis]|uniref:OprO/OprP family phosphate-selective porin n=2 Tax=Pedomonas mirosovicensis TaxID=2908641 RepID=UPI0021699465|nr:porin [Pedomonas mirosovicensis]MCH8686155.1 hypothetical protein [Pedomonas mirosovicensis]
MTTKNRYRAVLLATALVGANIIAAPAWAQQEAGPSETQQLREQLQALQSQMEELKAQIAKKEQGGETSWKGAPQSSGSGFTFKVRGRIQYDVGMVTDPDNLVDGKELGIDSYFRRARIGVEGAMPGDFKYKAEFDFADPEEVGYGDILIEYAPKDSPFSVKLGNMETHHSLEQMTSSRFITFMERAQITEAFYSGRRLGGSVGYAQGDLKFDAGFFNHAISGDRGDDSWLFGTRLVYAPKIGDNQLHFGANYQHREFNSGSLGNRYRARPFVRSTSVRFVDTGGIGAKSDDTFGLEAAGIFGPLHAVAEYQFMKVNAISPTEQIPADDTVSGTRLADNASFNGGYVELGYFLTGERRGYKNGAWDRTKVLNPVSKGGMGAFQVNARLDYLDLGDNVSDDSIAQYVNGGKQIGYGLSLIWLPIDYVKFMAQYVYVDVKDINRGADGRGIGSRGGAVGADSNANSHVLGLRAQIDW